MLLRSVRYNKAQGLCFSLVCVWFARRFDSFTTLLLLFFFENSYIKKLVAFMNIAYSYTICLLLQRQSRIFLLPSLSLLSSQLVFIPVYCASLTSHNPSLQQTGSVRAFTRDICHKFEHTTAHQTHSALSIQSCIAVGGKDAGRINPRVPLNICQKTCLLNFRSLPRKKSQNSNLVLYILKNRKFRIPSNCICMSVALTIKQHLTTSRYTQPHCKEKTRARARCT